MSGIVSEPALALSPSELVADRYRPLRPLGSGGSGSVWLARDERTGLDVALKIVPREGKAATRAEREALAAARLRHERCLRAYALERDTRNVYIAYEYVPGQTMRQALRAGDLDDASAVEAGAQGLGGLATGPAPLAQVRRDLPKPLCALVDRMLALDPAARPPAALLAHELRDALAERIRRRTRGPRVSLAAAPALRFAAPAAAGLFAGWTAGELPFYPGLAGPLFGVLAFALTLVRPRLGLAFALAVPVFPLGNISSGLAVAYGLLACMWLALSWRSPGDGLFLALGPLLAPISALGLLPLAGQSVRSLPRRALQVGAAVLLAAIVAGLRHSALPFTGVAPPKGLGIARSQDPFAVAVALWRALLDHPALLVEALALAAAAVALPFARERGPWGIAALGAGLIAVTILPAPSVAAAPLVVAAWATCTVLALRARG